jgi:uncharacterized protein YdhG (YjbR/CyaY superfamily)
MSPPRFSSLDEYFASLDDPVKATTLRSIIDVILADFPELQVKLAWNVPQIHRDGTYVLGLSAARNHLSVAPWSPRVMADFTARLEGYVVTPNLFHVSVDWDVDEDLIKDLVRARLGELD